jgi:hypothetical protein
MDHAYAMARAEFEIEVKKRKGVMLYVNAKGKTEGDDDAYEQDPLEEYDRQIKVEAEDFCYLGQESGNPLMDLEDDDTIVRGEKEFLESLDRALSGGGDESVKEPRMLHVPDVNGGSNDGSDVNDDLNVKSESCDHFQETFEGEASEEDEPVVRAGPEHRMLGVPDVVVGSHDGGDVDGERGVSSEPVYHFAEVVIVPDYAGEQEEQGIVDDAAAATDADAFESDFETAETLENYFLGDRATERSISVREPVLRHSSAIFVEESQEELVI